MADEETGVDKRHDARGSDDEDDRDNRFVETDDNPEFLQCSQYKNLKPYYNGSILDDRNAEMRQSIYYIRQHWDDYTSFIASLKKLFLGDETIVFKDKVTEDDMEKLFVRQRNWLTEEIVRDKHLTFEAIRLYTSKEGYARIYTLCNHVFRDEHCLVSREEVQTVVFLIELISIDLYNYCLKYPEKRDFQGTVYRGMVLPEDDFEQFKRLRDAPLKQRNIAVPLGKYMYVSELGVFSNQLLTWSYCAGCTLTYYF